VSLTCQPWVTGQDLLDDPCCPSNVDQATADALVAEATDTLYLLSGRQWVGRGACQQNIRPCSQRECCWDLRLCRTCCGEEYRLLLWGYPVTSVDRVVIDGALLDTTAFRLEEERWVRRIDGDFWPSCQDMNADELGEGGFLITYTYGAAPPAAGMRACLAYACQLAQGGPASCCVPAWASSIQRQGVSLSLADVKVGIPEVDDFLRAYNPSGLKRRPAVWSPRTRHHVRI
jgi:hypothetical protein